MAKPVTYSRSGAIGRIVMDDGKANVMSIDMLVALHGRQGRRQQVVAEPQ